MDGLMSPAAEFFGAMKERTLCPSATLSAVASRVTDERKPVSSLLTTSRATYASGMRLVRVLAMIG